MTPSRFVRPVRSKRRVLRCIGPVALLLLAGTAAHATTLVHLGTAQLADRSELIVRGTVTGTESRMHAEHRFPYTYISLRVDEVFKGNAVFPGQTVLLQELGGSVGETRCVVDAVPSFLPGEDVLVFLETGPEGNYRTYGMVQGKFSFQRDSRTGGLLLTRPPDLFGATLVASEEAGDLTPARTDGNYEAEPLLATLRSLRARGWE